MVNYGFAYNISNSWVKCFRKDINITYFIVWNKVCNSKCSSKLHIFSYLSCTAFKSTLEDTRECNNIINLVREIRTSCTNNFCTSCLGNIRHNLWNRVSHCKYNCIFIHSLDHIGCNDVRSRNSDKYICTTECIS